MTLFPQKRCVVGLDLKNAPVKFGSETMKLFRLYPSPNSNFWNSFENQGKVVTRKKLSKIWGEENAFKCRTGS
jgi:hypothetical protein